MYHLHPKDNELAKRFWVLLPIENASALFFYASKTMSTRVILQIKYMQKWSFAQYLGRVFANEAKDYGFFDGINVIVPVPLSREREVERGYNQSYYFALGIKEITNIPIVKDAISRTSFNGSQTRKSHLERRDNVKGVFKLISSANIKGKHILIVDDVITTGSTILSCAEELMKGGVKSISVASIGYAKHL